MRTSFAAFAALSVASVAMILNGCVERRPAVVYSSPPVYVQSPPQVIYSTPSGQPAGQQYYAPPPSGPVPQSVAPPSAFPGSGQAPENQPQPVVTQSPPTVVAQPQVVQGAPQVVQSPPVIVQTAPPAPVVEPMPVAPSVEYVWTPGYWSWNGRWVWVTGRWILPPHRHAFWVEGRWVHHPHGWRWEGGHWR